MSVPQTADWDPEADAPGGERGTGARGPGRMAEYARLQEECPVAWSDHHGGYWTLTRYADVKAASLDHRRLRSGQPFISMPDFTQSIPIGLNPPEHAPYRRLLNRYFIPARMDELEAAFRGYVDEHLDPILQRGGGDVVAEFCGPLPARGLCALLHMPEATWVDLVGHLTTIDAMREEDPDAVGPAIFGLFAEKVAELVAERRRNPLDPELDLVSGILAAEIDGGPLAEDAIVAIGVQIIAAGHGTTTDALAGAIYRIATSPEIQARLRRDPALIPGAVEEFLRLEVPLPELGRTAAEDLELQGRAIAAGCPVALNFAAANRDPEEFAHPDAVIVDRTPNRHLSFGHGVHKCVGAPFARLELRVALEQLLARTSDITLAGPAVPSPVAFSGGFAALPIGVRAYDAPVIERG